MYVCAFLVGFRFVANRLHIVVGFTRTRCYQKNHTFYVFVCWCDFVAACAFVFVDMQAHVNVGAYE